MAKSTAITDALMQKLGAISQSNGFETDIGAHVVRGMSTVGVLADDIPLPVIVVRTATENGDYLGPSRAVLSRSIEIETIMPPDGFTDLEAAMDAAAADIIKAITPASRLPVLGGLVSNMTIDAITYTYPDNPASAGAVLIQITAAYPIS